MKNKVWGKILFLFLLCYGMIIPVHAEDAIVRDYDVAVSSNATTLEWIIFIFGLFAFLGVIGFIVYAAIMKTKERRQYEIGEGQLQEILPEYTLDTLKRELYENYLTIQQAYSNYQYDQLDQFCSFILSKEYKDELTVLHEKHATNIMNGFELVDMKIQDVIKENDNVAVKVYLKVRYIDYTVDDQNVLLNGDYQNKVESEYIMEFYRKKYTGRPVRFCPSCGGEVVNRFCTKCGLEAAKKNSFLLRRKGAFL